MYVSNFEVQSFESSTFVNTEVHQMEATFNWFKVNTTIEYVWFELNFILVNALV
jgi:hypothetical protein